MIKILRESIDKKDISKYKNIIADSYYTLEEYDMEYDFSQVIQ